MNRARPLTLPLMFLLAATISSAAEPIDTNPKLYSTLWMRTSAEYEALCRQIYANAAQVILGRAAGMDRAGRPLAVVMDLDETVLDNSAYQVHRLHGGQQPFDQFVSQNVERIGLVPGAKDFVETMGDHGIVVVFISNRPDTIALATVRTLELNGVPTAGKEGSTLEDRTRAMKDERRLLLRTAGDHGKRRRRRLAAERYRIIAYVGDKLSDLPGPFEPGAKATPSERRAAVADAGAETPSPFGTRWFLLPNPVYGDWEAALGANPAQHLDE
jgi:5'-nucleotidase (lipoprotein e(P4) family)